MTTSTDKYSQNSSSPLFSSNPKAVCLYRFQLIRYCQQSYYSLIFTNCPIEDQFGQFQIGLSFTNRQAVQFKKNRTAGLSQSNARKYNRQCKLANQPKVPVTTHQKKSCWLAVVRRRTLSASCCCECRFVLLLFCFGILSGPFKRKMYDQTDESLYWKQSTILEYVQVLKLWTRIRKPH